MVALCPSPPARAWPLPNRVRIIESNQSGAIRRVQCQRVAEGVRSFGRRLGPHYDELHPMSRVVHKQRLAVKVEQGVQSRVSVRRRHRLMLSDYDNRRRERR